MKSEIKIKQWLLVLLSALMAAGVLTGIAAAAEPTGACTNLYTEGIEYFQPVSRNAADSNEWRRDLDVTVSPDGEVIAMELEVINSGTRYQCTEIAPSDWAAHFSCNSIPTNSVISGVYFRYVPGGSVTVDSDIQFTVTSVLNSKELLKTDAKVKYPPYPCARNLLKKDFTPISGETFVWNTSADCPTEHNTAIRFAEKEPPFALVNIIPTDTLDTDRFHLEVTPKLPFSYTLILEFEDSKDPTPDTIYVQYDWNETSGAMTVTATGPMPTQEELPLTLVRGTLTIAGTTHKDLWGDPAYPTSADFNIKFWYENTEGTLGYQNSVFHFERDLSIQFAPYCDADASTIPQTGVATALYDPCQASQQLFTIDLRDENGQGIIIPEVQDPSKCADPNDMTYCTTYACDNVDYCTDVMAVNPPIINYHWSHTIPAAGEYHFVTRRCLDANCSTYTTANAYPYSITVSDGLNKATTYRGYDSMMLTFAMNMYDYFDGASIERPMAITGLRFVADQPGTYMILGFVPGDYIRKGDLQHYAVKFYVTINKSNQLSTCYTLANNGYFKALWNDCLASGETQLMKFEHIPGKEEAWMRNTSSHGIHFPYVSQWSYIPQNLQIASLNCKFEALDSAGRPADGYCNPEDVYVPPHTKATITGGTLYLEKYPAYDEYFVAYAREETYNISHLFFSIYVEPCENKRIPNTGISLRSPLKGNESVDAATSYVFTGNSLRIPAIGLGMETPIPIVHVYYEEGSDNMEWDLSTLGNYVGELEGGAYLPYPGNSALTGHYFSAGVFKNLEHLNMEDEIIVFGNDGIKYTYKVVQKFIAQPTDVYEMFQQVGERSLTLVTCENYNLVTDEYERRQIIRATIDSMEPYVVNW